MNFTCTMENQHERIAIGIQIMVFFCYYVSTNIFGNMFDFIKWEDEEPWRIEDLKKLECEEYETD